MPAPLRTVHVAASRPYDVRCGAGALALLPELLGERRAVCVVDEHVAGLHLERLPAPLRAAPLLVARGEAAKTFEQLRALLERLAAAGLDRQSVVVALGGGATSDVAGLAAALYMRGIDWIACPTTLLSQVDAAVGGKTAIDLGAAKNLVGAFHQPLGVLADLETLATLDEVEFRSGLGELVKHALIDGEEALARVERDAGALRGRDPDALADAVSRAVAVKARIVAVDERETGERETLNLGHTFGHAIEHAAGFGAVPHGLAVAVGIGLALACAAETGRLEDPELPRRYARLGARLGLPTTTAELGLAPAASDPRAWLAAMRLDKKADAGGARLVLPRAAGRIERGVRVEEAALEQLLARHRGHPGAAATGSA